MVVISSLWVYPVKGCRGQAVQAVQITDTGFALDRHWMVINAKNKGIYQIPETRMALIEPRLPEGALLGDWRTLPPEVAVLTLTAPGMPPLKIGLHDVGAPGKKLVESSIWEWRGPTQDEGDEASAWLTKYLGKNVRLVRLLSGNSSEAGVPTGVQRPVASKWVPPGKTILTSFDFGFQFLCTSKDSAEDLHTRMGLQLPEDRWRPNIVTEGAAAWSEDLWERIVVTPADGSAAIEFASVRPCDRCKITATDQQTLEQAEEPLATLKSFRKGEHLGLDSPPSLKSAVFFGWYLLALTKGRVAIGDRIRVSKSRKEFRDFEHGAKVVAPTGLAALYQWLSELLRRFAAIISVWLPSKAQEAKVE